MKPLKFITISLAFCFLSSLIAVSITNVILSKKPANQKTKAEDMYSSSLILCHNFTKCGHTLSTSSDVVTYSSAKELENRFPGYEITSGDENEVVLTAKIENLCPFHYKATLAGSEITIIRLADNEKITSANIMARALSKEEKNLLEQGLTLDSQKALTSFLEDFTS